VNPWLPPVDQDPDEAQDAACRIVERTQDVCRPVETLPPSRPSSTGSSGGSGGAFDLVGLLMWVLLFAVVGFLLYLLVRYLAERNGWAGRSKRSAADESDDDDLDIVEADAVMIDRSREPFNWRTEADRHRAEGRYRDALRCRYRALVGDLARRGLIDEIPGRTTGEEREQLRVVTPPASAPFDEAAELFDGAWYGHLPVDDSAVAHFQTLEQAVLDRAVLERSGGRR